MDPLLDSANERRRTFVKHRGEDYPSEIQWIKQGEQAPIASILIPTRDAYRNGYFPELLRQIERQSFKSYEVIIIKGDPRQGRAINTGAALARGQILIVLDDDTRLGHERVFENLVRALNDQPDIGMAGVSNLIPKDAPWLVRRAMLEIPRRRSEPVPRITDSDMAEHPCCAFPKSVFCRVGGENELMPRGLDPYLRHALRSAGYRVVVIPFTWIHHLLPDSLGLILHQYFRNGWGAGYCNKFYSQWVFESAKDHAPMAKAQEGLGLRGVRYLKQLAVSLAQLRWIYFLTQLSYMAGFILGLSFARKEER